MAINQVISQIKEAINDAPATPMFLNCTFRSSSIRIFCEALEIGPSFGTGFTKMKKIAPRRKAAGLDVSTILVGTRLEVSGHLPDLSSTLKRPDYGRVRWVCGVTSVRSMSRPPSYAIADPPSRIEALAG